MYEGEGVHIINQTVYLHSVYVIDPCNSLLMLINVDDTVTATSVYPVSSWWSTASS